MSSILFRNPSVLPIEAIQTFGLNVKPESDNPIGFFGTGLKYALAILLREGCEVKIFINPGVEDENYHNFLYFGTKTEIIRGKEFTFVEMNGKSLGYTLELGKNWSLQQAYRELYSNCMDENGSVHEIDDFEFIPYEPSNNAETQILVSSPKFTHCHTNRHEIILQQKKLSCPTSGGVEIYPGQTSTVFYRGFAAYTTSKPTLFTYNILSDTTLTEDRTIKYEHHIRHELTWTLFRCEDKEVISKIMLAPEGYYEKDLNFDNRLYPAGEIFLDTLADLYDETPFRMNQSAIELLKHHRKKKFLPKLHPLSSQEQIMLDNSIQLLQSHSFHVTKYPIHICEDLGRGVFALAMFEEKSIYLSAKLFLEDQNKITQAVLEEYLHLETGFGDETREFQSFLFQTLVKFLNLHRPKSKKQVLFDLVRLA